jgi:hypothetical protein
MADQVEKTEAALSVLARIVISLVMPLWALAMLVLGFEYRSIWWLGCGVVVGAISLLLFVGNPVAQRFLSER